jgi:ribosomal protein S18 acetylase RimI-like enzyme
MSVDFTADYTIAEWRGENPADLGELAEVLHAVVHADASVSFILPFSIDEARRFWTDKVLPGVAKGSHRVLVARSGGKIVGTVQLELAGQPNQQHRAEVAKLLVHPEARRRGIARALMARLEELASSERRTLLTLDTRTGDKAEPLYQSMGYVLVGRIPGFARGPFSPKLESTTIFYKELAE